MASGVNVLVRNDHDVTALQSALHHGAVNLRVIPELVKVIIRDGEWRERVIESTGEVVTFPSFIAFVTSARPAGLDVEVKALKRLCQDDTEAFDLIDAADQNPTGVHNIHTTRPSGTSEQAALRRLRKDRPDLHEQVIAHGMSAHAAMVSAGYRPKTVTVRTDPSAFARAARKHLTDDQIEELVEMLESDE